MRRVEFSKIGKRYVTFIREMRVIGFDSGLIEVLVSINILHLKQTFMYMYNSMFLRRKPNHKEDYIHSVTL